MCEWRADVIELIKSDSKFHVQRQSAQEHLIHAVKTRMFEEFPLLKFVSASQMEGISNIVKEAANFCAVMESSAGVFSFAPAPRSWESKSLVAAMSGPAKCCLVDVETRKNVNLRKSTPGGGDNPEIEWFLLFESGLRRSTDGGMGFIELRKPRYAVKLQGGTSRMGHGGEPSAF